MGDQPAFPPRQGTTDNLRYASKPQSSPTSYPESPLASTLPRKVSFKRPPSQIGASPTSPVPSFSSFGQNHQPSPSASPLNPTSQLQSSFPRTASQTPAENLSARKETPSASHRSLDLFGLFAAEVPREYYLNVKVTEARGVQGIEKGTPVFIRLVMGEHRVRTKSVSVESSLIQWNEILAAKGLPLRHHPELAEHLIVDTPYMVEMVIDAYKGAREKVVGIGQGELAILEQGVERSSNVQLTNRAFVNIRLQPIGFGISAPRPKPPPPQKPKLGIMGPIHIDRSVTVKSLLTNTALQIRQSITSYGQTIETIFGRKQLLYADCVSTESPMKPVEAYIRKHFVTEYSSCNAYSHLGNQAIRRRNEAAGITLKAVGGRPEGPYGDAVFFTGTGAPDAIRKLIALVRLPQAIQQGKKCVVFMGPHESLSHFDTWQEVPGLTVVQIPETSNGTLDIAALGRKLTEYQRFDYKFGSFAAISEITGVMAPTEMVTKVLHVNGAFAFWDYSVAANHIAIDMNPGDDPTQYKDAIFLSPYKIPGGPGGTGILVAKRHVLEDTEAIMDHIEKDNMLGIVRAGCALHYRSQIRAEVFQTLSWAQAQKIRGIAQITNVVSLGPPTKMEQRVSIFSFLVSVPWDSERYLPPGLVSALLSDVYGIQVGVGHFHAGVHLPRLLECKQSVIKELEAEATLRELDYFRPGFVRLSLPYYTMDDELDYALEAIQDVALYGWAMLPQYNALGTGQWRYHDMRALPESRSVSVLKWPPEEAEMVPSPGPVPQDYRRSLKKQLKEAKEAMVKAFMECEKKASTSEDPDSIVNYPLRWFALPSEAVRYAQGYPTPQGRPILKPYKYGDADEVPVKEEVPIEATMQPRKGSGPGMSRTISSVLEESSPGTSNPSSPSTPKGSNVPTRPGGTSPQLSRASSMIQQGSSKRVKSPGPRPSSFNDATPMSPNAPKPILSRTTSTAAAKGPT